MKHRLYILFFSLFANLSFLIAQNDWKAFTSIADFQDRLKREASHITSIESDFKQEKYLSVFEEKVFSQGHFYYKKPDKIRMAYRSPVPYLIVINNQWLRIESEGKKNTVDLASNPMMNEMKKLIAACLVGDLQKMGASYRFTYFENAHSYLIKILPADRNVQTYIHEIQIIFDKRDLSVEKLRIAETAQDYTAYHFTQRKHNTFIGDEMFSVH